MTNRVHNFSAGPATLPLPVLERAHEELLALPGVGISALEISHRSDWCQQMMATTENDLRQLLNVPDGYKVLFLQGGASLQFTMIPMNIAANRTAAYAVTGSWGKKAIAEAKRHGEVAVVWDGADANYARTPRQDELSLPDGAALFHYTSNETIQGVQYQTPPSVSGAEVICDHSSDFLSRPVDVSQYGLIYAGAQKNAGPAGVTIVIVNDSLLQQIPDNLPTMLDYRTFAKSGSAHNTPPVYSIYIVGLVAQWLKDDIGGLAAMHDLNQQKAALLYDVIDGSNGFYKPHADAGSRSLMNVTFTLADSSLDKPFLETAIDNDLHELKGHRSVGGFRASIYNAMPRASVECLAQFMRDFQQANG